MNHNDISYILHLQSGSGRWSFRDILDLVPCGFIDPGDCERAAPWRCSPDVRLHSLTEEEAELYSSILMNDYGAIIHQEIQRGSYRG